MKQLPYFCWYPADAEIDENYRAMTDAEVGFYHRCLNHAWLNHGLPADPDERSKALGKAKKYCDERWKRVGRCFVVSPDDPARLINPRQELERSNALTGSSTERVRRFRERTRNGFSVSPETQNVKLRASGGVSESVSESEKQENFLAENWSALWALDPYGTLEGTARAKFLEIMASAVNPEENSSGLVASRSAWLKYCKYKKIKPPGTLKWLESGDCFKAPPEIAKGDDW